MTPAIDDAGAGPGKVLLRPQPVTWAFRVTIAWAVFTLLTSLSLFTERSFLRRSLVDNNAKAKKPITDLTGDKLDRAVHNALLGGIAQAILMMIILIMLGTMLLRGRPWARWALLAFATVLPVLIGVGIGVAVLLFGVVTGDSPLLYRVPLVAAGLCSLAVVILLLMPETNRYFNAIRPAGRRGMFGRPGGSTDDLPAGGVRPGRPAVRSSGATRPAGATRPVTGVQRRHNGVFGALFAPRRAVDPGADGSSGGPGGGSTAIGTSAAGSSSAGNSSASSSVAGTSGAAASSTAKSGATRPGSVKAKGTGSRPGRSKSRQD